MSGDTMVNTLNEALREEKKAKELLISRLRIMIALLAIIPAGGVEILLSGAREAWFVLPGAWAMIIAYAGGIYVLLQKDFYRDWLGYLTLFSDSIGFGLYLMLFSFFNPGHMGALYEPLFAVYYIISVSGTIKYDFRYSFLSIGICSLMVFVLVWFDYTVHDIALDSVLVGEKLLMLGIFTIISHVFYRMFTRIVIAEHELMKQRVKEISTIQAIGSDISSCRKLDKTLTNIAHETRALMRADLCYLSWRNEGQEKGRSLIASGALTKALDAIELKPGIGVEGRLLAGCEAITMNSAQDLACQRGIETEHLCMEGVATLLGMPLSIESRAVGAFIVARRNPIPFNDYDRMLLGTLSQQAALTIQNASLLTRLQKEQVPYGCVSSEKLTCFEGMLGTSEKMQRLFHLIQKTAPTDHPVLIRGESGTGKELVARAVHARSSRAQGPFIAINCSAIPDNLLESELFGYERGAFTGAHRLRKGKFELAHRGTIFLDEIGDMNLSLQTKLLRVLQNQEFERLGGETAIQVDVRVISATHQDLEERMVNGTFRQDLFYRISTLSIPTPALRDRREDIPLLVEHFIADLSAVMGKRVRLTSGAMEFLIGREWKGNVRELENVIKRMMAMSEHELVRTSEIEELFQKGEQLGEDSMMIMSYIERALCQGCSLAEETRGLERGLIEQALRRARGNISEASRMLKIPKTTLFNKIQKYNLAPTE